MTELKDINTIDEFEKEHRPELHLDGRSYFSSDTFLQFLKVDSFDTTRLGDISSEILKHENVQNLLNRKIMDLEIELEKQEKKAKRVEYTVLLEKARTTELKVDAQKAAALTDLRVTSEQDKVFLVRDEIVQRRYLVERFTDRISYLYKVREDIKLNREPAAPIGYERLENLIAVTINKVLLDRCKRRPRKE